jgi:uncharacterized glyoxalase superfamily protein PhnB
MIFTRMSRILSITILVLTGLSVVGCSNFIKQGGNSSRFEHIAINVEDPIAMADWYCKNLDMKVKFEGDPPNNISFISDSYCRMMFELYENENAAKSDFNSMDMVTLHIAFMVDDVKGTCDRLIEAGAKMDKELTVNDSGDEIATLRDPWGLPIQFVKRAKPMIKY